MNKEQMDLAFDLLKSMAQTGEWDDSSLYGNWCDHLADHLYDSDIPDEDIGKPLDS